MTEVKKTRGRKPKAVSLVDSLKKETNEMNETTSRPANSGPVLVVQRNGVVVDHINPNSVELFAKKNGLDVNAVKSIIDRTYVNHEGFTFFMEK